MSSSPRNAINGKTKDLVLWSLYLRERKETLKKLNNPVEKQQNTGNLQKRKYKQFTLLKASDLGSGYICTFEIYSKPSCECRCVFQEK